MSTALESGAAGAGQAAARVRSVAARRAGSRLAPLNGGRNRTAGRATGRRAMLASPGHQLWIAHRRTHEVRTRTVHLGRPALHDLEQQRDRIARQPVNPGRGGVGERARYAPPGHRANDESTLLRLRGPALPDPWLDAQVPVDTIRASQVRLPHLTGLGVRLTGDRSLVHCRPAPHTARG